MPAADALDMAPHVTTAKSVKAAEVFKRRNLSLALWATSYFVSMRMRKARKPCMSLKPCGTPGGT